MILLRKLTLIALLSMLPMLFPEKLKMLLLPEKALFLISPTLLLMKLKV